VTCSAGALECAIYGVAFCLDVPSSKRAHPVPPRGCAGRPATSLPLADNVAQIGIVDLLGTGTACLVWSSPLIAAEALTCLGSSAQSNLESSRSDLSLGYHVLRSEFGWCQIVEA
jgi:hypothetical protein